MKIIKTASYKLAENGGMVGDFNGQNQQWMSDSTSMGRCENCNKQVPCVFSVATGSTSPTNCPSCGGRLLVEEEEDPLLEQGATEEEEWNPRPKYNHL